MNSRIEKAPRNYSAYLILGILAISTLLRVSGLFGDFWFDEIWSLFMARDLNSPLEIITKLHHDNNHFLNTFFIYVMGDQPLWLFYRLPSFAAGIGAVALAGWIMRRCGKVKVYTILVLFGISYLMTHYSSEARGYASMTFFALLAYYLLERYRKDEKWQTGLLFGGCVILGFSSQFSFLIFYIAALIWSACFFNGKGKTASGWVRSMVKAHAVPIIFLGFLYFIHIRYLEFGGGPVYNPFEVARSALSWVWGIQGAGWPAAVVQVATFLMFVAGLALLKKEKSGEWIFFLLVVIIVPAGVLLFSPTNLIYVRYFLISVVFLLIVLGHVLCRLYELGGLARAGYFVLLILFCLGNGYSNMNFIKFGRGNYFEALKYMADETPGENIVIGSDNDSKNEPLLDFYARYLPENKKVVYVEYEDIREYKPIWFIQTSQVIEYYPPEALTLGDQLYFRQKEYPYYGLSGWSWYIFRKK